MDSVAVAVSGSVPWSYRCEACDSALFYKVRAGADGVPESMFCGKMACPKAFRSLDFPR